MDHHSENKPESFKYFDRPECCVYLRAMEIRNLNNN